jgi:hypothetical protein
MERDERSYEAMALTEASNNRGLPETAVAFAVLHLAEQVGRVADHLDRLADDGSYSPSASAALRVVLR